jgi:predicted small secreted protein
VRLRRFRRIVSLITVGVASSVLLAGCPDPNEVAGVGVTGCQRKISGVTGVTRPETSKLSCAAINNLVSSIPSEPENYLISGDSPRLLWKCRFYGTEQGSVLLRCENDKRHFGIVKR